MTFKIKLKLIVGLLERSQIAQTLIFQKAY